MKVLRDQASRPVSSAPPHSARVVEKFETVEFSYFSPPRRESHERVEVVLYSNRQPHAQCEQTGFIKPGAEVPFRRKAVVEWPIIMDLQR